MNKTKLAIGIATATLAMTSIMVPQDALAHKRKKSHSHHRSVSRSYTTSGGNESMLTSKVEVLESQLRAMQDEMSAMRAQSGQSADTAKVQELDTWMQETKATPRKEDVSDMIFFRGGYARNDTKRDDLLTGNQFGGDTIPALAGVLGGNKSNKDGWYIGAGFDFGLTDDVWGLMGDTEVDAELMFEWKSFSSKKFNAAATVSPNINPNPKNGPLCTLINFASGDELPAGAHGAGSNSCNSVNVSQLTLTAAPKIKFMKGSKFRPWLIPIGLGLHVISPPSNGVTVLNPGMMFGAGAEYQVWKAMHVGADVRYHLTGRSVDGVNTDGLTAGGYLGIGF